MSDDLVKQLRNSKGWPTLGNAAADLIEELEAKLAEWQAQQHYVYIGRDGKAVLARDLEARIEDLEANLVKAVEEAYAEGFAEGSAGDWIEGDYSKPWAKSQAFAELIGGEDE